MIQLSFYTVIARKKVTENACVTIQPLTSLVSPGDAQLISGVYSGDSLVVTVELAWSDEVRLENVRLNLLTSEQQEVNLAQQLLPS